MSNNTASAPTLQKKSGLAGFNLKKNTMLLALIALMIAFEILIVAQSSASFMNHDFFAPANISNLIGQNSYVLILAVGMLLCILTGGNIDLSVGSGVCMISALAGVFIVNLKLPLAIAVPICLLIGIGIGALQGYFIAYAHIPAFIVTLAGMLTFRGIGNIILDGKTISPFPANYSKIFNAFLPSTSTKIPTLTTTPKKIASMVDSGDISTSIQHLADKNNMTVEQLSNLKVADLRPLISAYNDSIATTLLMVTLAIGAVVSILFIIMTFLSRAKKQRKGYPVGALVPQVVKTVLVVAVIMFLSYLLGNNKGFPVILITLGIVIIGYWYFTSKSVPGRYLYALGGNAKSAKFSGINTDKMMFFAYTNMGFLVAVASLVCVARFNSAAPSAGTSYELDAIGACFIGGASAYGGVGTVGGTVIGAIFMGVLNNGMSILGIDANWQKAIKGIVLLIAVLADVSSQKKGSGGGLFSKILPKKDGNKGTLS
ncbi:MAG: sugar ABC transporter permease [Clostridiales Family XIII bacterium]|jgi:putative multiple sugar transport system permease protein|nr:sugar ABC transporter permease [Clostridiales Family XIII bacterium]